MCTNENAFTTCISPPRVIAFSKYLGGNNYDRKNRRHLPVFKSKKTEASLPLHDAQEVFEDAGESASKYRFFDRFTAIECDAFGIFPKTHETEAKIRFGSLTRRVRNEQRSRRSDLNPLPKNFLIPKNSKAFLEPQFIGKRV